MRHPMTFIVIAILLLAIATAPPSQQRTVRGTVYKSDGVTQAKLGTLVFINNTNHSILVTTQTFGPPTQPGRYSATILANPYDLMHVLAYNATSWGHRYGVMGTTQVVIDLNLNRTRDSESWVRILYPQNNTHFFSTDEINVTANITVLGNNGINCNATILFSVPDVFKVDSATVDLGNINRGNSVLVKFNITSGETGVTNITVVSKCASDGINLQSLNQFTAYNISNSDITPPQIIVIAPQNNTRKNSPVLFLYNVSDGATIVNCTLNINDAIANNTEYAQQKENFTVSLASKYNSWNITCLDSSSNKATNGMYNLTRNDLPYLSSQIAPTINLNAGSNKTVYCNGTATDEDSYSDIINVNSSLFFEGLNVNDPLNRSNHYSNSSCTLFNAAGNSVDYRCAFHVEYYARNGTWHCNSTATDIINATNTSQQNTEINELLAIGVNPNILDFGSLQVMQISPNDAVLNITNFGNIPLDLRLSAYANFENDNLSLDCTKRNISMEYERWSLLPMQFFDSMTSVNRSSTPAQLDISLKRKGYGDTADSIGKVYFKLQIPFFADGKCNGKILFSAVSG